MNGTGSPDNKECLSQEDLEIRDDTNACGASSDNSN